MNNNDSRLIRLLLKQTLDGKAAWDDTISSDTYQADLENAIVQSFSYEGNWDSMHYGIRILRKTDGVALKTLMSDDPDCDADDRNTMKRIFERAREIALNADDTINSLLGELGGGADELLG